MAWRQIASDIPINDWSLERGIHAVAVRDQLYLFGYQSSGGSDTLQARAFNPRACTWSALPPLAGGEARVHFAVASEEKVFVCVGAHEMKVFDTRSSRWSSVTTSGDVELEGFWVYACELHGHVYVCHSELRNESPLWALDINRMRWEIMGTWERSDEISHVGGLFSYENCLYVLFHEYSSELSCGIYVIRHFDLVKRRWADVSTCKSQEYHALLLQPFIHGGKLFNLLGSFGTIEWHECVMQYSFGTRKCAYMKFNGKPPRFLFHLVSVVGDMVLFFSCSHNKVCILDLSLSLRNLCIEAVHNYQLDTSLLPPILQKDVKHYNLQLHDIQ